jgi:hypothetical protein
VLTTTPCTAGCWSCGPLLPTLTSLCMPCIHYSPDAHARIELGACVLQGSCCSQERLGGSDGEKGVCHTPGSWIMPTTPASMPCLFAAVGACKATPCGDNRCYGAGHTLPWGALYCCTPVFLGEGCG